MFFTTLLCLPLLWPGFATLMTSPLDEPFHQSFSQTDKESSPGTSTEASELVRLPRSASVPDITHLELLVVVGPDVQQVHKQDTERYILTNLNIASELLRDMTLGANMRVHLVRMIILTEAEPEIQMSTSIDSSLRSVCDWGRRINPSNDTDPLHADLLLYITRYDLGLPDGNKQVRGVTYLGGVCSSERSCVITEDTGFDLGITIAHEIGHSFGINHDGLGNNCFRSGFMMATDGGYNSVDLTWSPCSREQLLTFFSKGKAECLKDLPALEGSLQDWKPGLYYGVDDQCRIAFGSSARACSFTNPDLPACRVLSCHTNPDDDSSCKRLLVPLLDGTECAPNQWCLRGRCVSLDELTLSVVVHGCWSSWSEFSTCSRTCGGGVTHRTRKCNNPRPAFGGNECEGPDVEAKLCHQQPCERTQLDFMSEQCSQTDPHPVYQQPNQASFYTWIPAVGFSKGDEQCRYMCLSSGENFIVSRGPQFVDGTRCEFDGESAFGSTAACLRGKCQLFGCDGVLHSGKVRDVCGVCSGDGSSCSLTSDSYNGGQAKVYTTFLTLPVNATQVTIVNMAPLFTHMAVLVGDRYIVSGLGSMALKTTHPSPLEDHRLEYHLHLTRELLPEMEELLLPGPLQEEIHVQVYRNYGKEYGEKTNPNISYHFYTPTRNIDNKPRGQWAVITTPCSVSCGSGIQKHSYVCVDVDTNDHLEEKNCESSAPLTPPQTPCQLSPCPPRWETGLFGTCSASCGGGQRVRPVRCVQEQGADVVTVPDSECATDAAPNSAEKCNLQQCPARKSLCLALFSNVANGYVFFHLCTLIPLICCLALWTQEETTTTEETYIEPSMSDYDSSDDDVPFNVDVQGNFYELEYTEEEILQKETQQAERERGQTSVETEEQERSGVTWWSMCVNCKPKPGTLLLLGLIQRWRVSMPGECSAVCGPGEAKLNVSCVRPEGGQEVEVDQKFCSKLIKPSESVPCVVDVCPIGWESKGEDQPMLKSGSLPHSSQTRVYVWSPVISQCSQTCGNGTLQVWFSCVDHQTRRGVLDLHCDGSSKPSPYSEPCNTFPCPPMWSTPPPSTDQPPLVSITTRWRAKQGACSVTCGGGLVNRVIYCSRETDGGGEAMEEVLEDAECSGFFKPPAVVSCNTHNCPARWRVFRTSSCSVSCDLGVAQRTVSCVQFLHGEEKAVPEENCHAAVKPATTVPCLVQACTFRWEVRPWSQCSVPCGYGIQSRAVSCMGPSNQEPISPLLCMHMPKPITIQGCHMDSCGSTTLTSDVTTAGKTEAGVSEVEKPPSLSPTESVRLSTATVPTPKQSACGQLFLEESGTVDLRNMSRCTVSIGRPLDEVIHVKVESGSLNCRRKEHVVFYDRLVLVRKCEQVAGSELTTRTNVLLVRQSSLTPENGVLFTYTSQKSQKKSHHQDCDIQLFYPNGVFENPTTSSTNHTCRVLINAPPAMKIKIQSLHMGIVFNSTNSQSTYIMIRDLDVLKTSVFKGQQQFLWQSTGNMAEVEFHGDYLHNKGSFRAEFSFLHP